jgi:POT family proton-dependent oligopeptide transporter
VDTADRRFFGYPRWFRTLFFTDLWERFSFYGMQSILVLWAAAPQHTGGLGLPTATAASMFGVYLAVTFMCAVPGAWLGDRVLGSRRATLWGAISIACGHYAMAVPARATAAVGLALIAIGSGLIKPNISALVSAFFGPDRSVQREVAFSLVYMSMQISAITGPLVAGFLGEMYNWHLGFGAAGVGMTIGVAHFLVGRRHFGDAGGWPSRAASPSERSRMLTRVGCGVTVAVLALTADALAGTFRVEHAIIGLGLISLTAPIAYTVALLRRPEITATQRRRLRVFRWPLLSATLFWLLVGQSGSLLNFFAQRSTERSLFGFEVPASWYQSATPFFIVVVTPAFAWAWLRLGRRAGVSAKLALGVALAGASFLVMAVASQQATGGHLVLGYWLLAVYFLHACGEVALAPVGLSATSDVAPPAFAVQTVALWWLFSALGGGIGGQVVRLSAVVAAPVYYAGLGLLALAGAAALAMGRRRVDRVIMPGAHDPAAPVTRQPHEEESVR